MATPAVSRSTPTPKVPPPSVKQSNVAQTQSNRLPNTDAGNQAAYRTLAESSKLPVKEPAAVPTSTAPATVAGGGKSKLKLPPLSGRARQEMVDDIEKIVAIMKTQYVYESEEKEINGILAKYSNRDRGLRPPLGETLSPNLDHFLILMKSRSFSRSSVKSIGQDQYAILYDAIWYRFGEEGLDEFKNLVARSQTEKTAGPAAKDVENGAALIAKQEAMGMWGMLKGMGTGLVGIAGPVASQKMAEQFDEAARELFGHEWDNSEPLVWGMNAGQIGTVGGDVIWQLVTFARNAPKVAGGKILTVVNYLKNITDKVHVVIAVSGGLQGVYVSATGIARIIEEKQKAGIKITAKELMNDGPFVDQLVTLMSSVINTTIAVKGAKVPPLTRRRVQLLLGSAHITASISHLATIAASDKSDLEKELAYGQVVMSLIPQLVSAAIDVKGYADDKKAKPATTEKKTGDEQAPEKDVAAPTDEHDQAPPVKQQGDEESGELSRKTMIDPEQPIKKAPKYVDESPAGQKLQADLAQEADTGLAPRQAPQTPEDVASGARPSRYKPSEKPDVSLTVGKPMKTLDEARARYDDVIAETRGQYEVGIYQKPDGTFAVRLGQIADVNAPTEWRSVQHFHTNEPDIPLWRMPARADMAEPMMRADRTNKPTTEIVEYPLPGGKRGRAAYTVNPDGSMKVEYVDAAGKKQTKPFASVKDYNEYYKKQTVFLDPEGPTYKRILEGPAAPKADADPNTSTKTQYGPAPDENAAVITPLTKIGKAEAKKNKALKPSGDPFKKLGNELRKDKTDFRKKSNKKDPLVAVRIGSDTKESSDTKKSSGAKKNSGAKEKGQYWVEGSAEFEGAHDGKGKDKTVKPEFVVLPKSQAEALQFRPAGTPFDPSIVPRKQGKVPLESTGAGRRLKKDPEGNERGHKITGRANKQADEASSADTFKRTIGADVAQAHGYNHVLTNGELGILRPGNISRGGVDGITAKIVKGKAQIFLNDFTDIDTPKPSKDTHAKWFKELQAAVAGKRLNFGNATTNAAIRQAIKDGEVYVRTVRVDTTPEKNLPVTVGTPEKLELGQ